MPTDRSAVIRWSSPSPSRSVTRPLGASCSTAPEPTLTGDLSGTIERTDVGATAASEPFSKFHLDIDIPHTSPNIDIKFTPHNFRGVLDTSMGFDDISMQLTVPTAQNFEAELPIVVPSDDLPTGDGAGAIDTPGGQDEYDFTLADDSPLLLEHQTCAADLRTELVNLDTHARHRFYGCDDVVTEELSAGDYRLEVTSETARNYTLRLDTPPAPQTFAYTVGDVVSDGVPSTGAGNLETIDSVDKYTFTVPTGGQSLQFEQYGGFTPFKLYDDDDELVASGWDQVLDLAAGDYTMVFDQHRTTTYSFHLFELPDQQVFTYNIGDLVDNGHPSTGAGNLETIDSVDKYQFTVPTGGAQIQYEMYGGWIPFKLYDHTNTLVKSGWDQIMDLDAGDYTMVFDEHRATTYAFHLFVIPDPQTFAYTVGDLVNDGHPAAGAGNLETIDSVDKYTFTVPTGGQQIQYEMYGGWIPFKLYDGTDTLVASGWDQILDLDAGDYTMVFDQHKATTYAFHLFVIPDPETFALPMGSTVHNGYPATGAGNLETIDSVDKYTFTVPTGGQELLYEMFGGWIPFKLYDDTNTLVASGGGQYIDLDAGDYTIVFDEHRATTYEFKVSVVP